MRYIALLLLYSGIFSTEAATVNWGAQLSNGIGTVAGLPLQVGSGDLLRIGWFSFNTNVTLNNSQILINANKPNVLNANFIEFGSSVIGSGTPNGAGSASDGYWTGVSSNPGGKSPDALGIAGQQIYYWLYNAATLANATQYGVYTDPPGANISSSKWIFPHEADVPNTQSNDLSQVPHNSTGIVIGTYGTGTSRDNVSPLFNLAIVPEPSAFVLAALGMGLLSLWKSRISITKV